MGLGIGAIVGWLIELVVFYLMIRNFTRGKRHLTYYYLTVLSLFFIIGVVLYFFDSNLDFATKLGIAAILPPLLVVRLFNSGILIVITLVVYLTLIFIVSPSYLNKKYGTTTTAISTRPNRVVRMVEFIVLGTFIVVGVVWWLSF